MPLPTEGIRSSNANGPGFATATASAQLLSEHLPTPAIWDAKISGPDPDSNLLMHSSSGSVAAPHLLSTGDAGNSGVQEPTTAMLDACIRDLTRRRIAMAQQHVAATATGGGGGSMDMAAAAGMGMAVKGLDDHRIGFLPMGRMNGMDGIGMQTGVMGDGRMNSVAAAGGMMGGRAEGEVGSGSRRGGTGLADFAGTADSFAQAFVDRWASTNSAAGATATLSRGGGGVPPAGLNNGYLHSISSDRNDINDSVSSSGGCGARGSNKLWWVCDYCKNKAFMSREELLEHESYCEVNPTRSSSKSGGKESRAEKILSGGGMVGNGWNTGLGGTSAAIKAMSSAVGMIGSNQMHSLGSHSRPGSINSSAHGDHPGLHHTGMAGHHPMGSRAPPLQSTWLPPGINPYFGVNDASMAMNPHTIMYGMGGGMPYAPDGMSSMMADAVTQAAEHTARRKLITVQAISPELIEASKGPFRQLRKPIALALKEDKDWLTPLHCFVRKHCVEVFTATELDVQTPSKGKRKPIQVGQIGIRCLHCHEGRMDTDPNRERGSVYYPTSLSSIYNATMNLLQRHLRACPKVPDSIMEQYKELKDDDARSGTSKAYWIESAKSLGFVDTLNGIKLSAKEPPPPPSTSESQKQTNEARRCNEIRTDSEDRESDVGEDGKGANNKSALDDAGTATEENVEVEKEISGDENDDAEEDIGADEAEEDSAEKKKENHLLADAPPLVTPADKNTSTAFSFLLLSQMQSCVFTEADRLGKRKGLPPGFAGLACKHCFGGYGSGRYFPSSIKTISDTSKTLNVLHNHMTRCRRVPKEVLEELEVARATHDEERAKMKFGSQKAFFAKIWSRLHDSRPDGVVIKPPPRKPSNTTANGGLQRLPSAASVPSSSSQGSAMAIHGWGAAGVGTNGIAKPSPPVMSAHMAMALGMCGGAANSMQYPMLMGEASIPK